MDMKSKKLVKDLIELVVANKLDFLEVGDIKISRTIQHKETDPKASQFIHNENASTPESEEEALFWSAR